MHKTTLLSWWLLIPPKTQAVAVLEMNLIYMHSIWAGELLCFCFYWMPYEEEVLSSAAPALSPPETECWIIYYPVFVLEAIYTEHDFYLLRFPTGINRCENIWRGGREEGPTEEKKIKIKVSSNNGMVNTGQILTKLEKQEVSQRGAPRTWFCWHDFKIVKEKEKDKK